MNKVRNVLLASIAVLLLFGSITLAQNNTGMVPATDYCTDLAERIGGIPIPNNDVCDVVVVRKTPVITDGHRMNLNKFTLMNSVIEFTKSGMRDNEVYVMGDFALLETEVNKVLPVITKNYWTVTGMHNHMILESPKMSFVHWEVRGNLDSIVDQVNEAFAQTSIK
jgi:hypothetical protein